MAKNEKTSKTIGQIASRAIKGLPLTKKEIQRLGASALTQRPNKK
jgi:hypothetical protein